MSGTAAALRRRASASQFFTQGRRCTCARVDGVDLHDRRRRVRRARGPERLGQDDAAPAPRRARPAERAARCSSRAATSRKLRDNELAELRLRAFGFVFQQFNLIPTLTALQNVEVGARADRRAAATSCASASLALLAEVGLADRADHLPGAALGRRAAARRDRARARRRAARDPRRRADRQPRHEDRRRRDRPARRASPPARRDGVVATHDASLAARAPRRLAMRDGAIVAAAPPPSEPQLGSHSAFLRGTQRCDWNDGDRCRRKDRRDEPSPSTYRPDRRRRDRDRRRRRRRRRRPLRVLDDSVDDHDRRRASAAAAERRRDRAARSRSTTIYQRTHQGVVDLTVTSSGGSSDVFGGAVAAGRGLGLRLRQATATSSRTSTSSATAARSRSRSGTARPTTRTSSAATARPTSR